MAKPKEAPAPMSSAGMPAWPADQVERRAVDALVPYAKNARTHSPAQVAALAAAVRQWGWTSPVLVDEAGGIIAGHGRVLAARQLGLAEVPVMVARGWTEAQKRAFVIADNQLALQAGWDRALLQAELGDLQAGGFDLGLTGFDLGELGKILEFGTKGRTDPDEAPPAPVVPVSRPGDVWRLGGHYLVCGDCTDPVAVGKALAGAKPHLMVTDPPYGVKYDAAWRQRAGVGGAGAATGKVLNDDRADWREAWALFPGDVAYVWHAGTFCGAVAESLAATKFQLRAQIIWVKTRLVLSRGDYHHQHEPCLYGVREGGDEQWHFVPEHEVSAYAVRKGAVGHYEGGRKQSTIWNIEHIKSETGHSTQKPVECMRRPIENNSRPGDAVYEPFSGSGTTIIAGEMTGRRVHALELHPAYVDVAVQRWQAFTGAQAVLQASGEAFDVVAAARLAEAAAQVPEAADAA
jgi:DNA modification methylase